MFLKIRLKIEQKKSKMKPIGPSKCHNIFKLLENVIKNRFLAIFLFVTKFLARFFSRFPLVDKNRNTIDQNCNVSS